LERCLKAGKQSNGQKSLVIMSANAVKLPLEDQSIDLTFTSVPFKDQDVEGDYWTNYAQWMQEIFRVTRKAICIIQSATRLNYLLQHYPPKRVMVWGKGISCYAWRWNPILVYQVSDDYKVNKYIWCDAFGVQAVQGKWKSHKYQDPELLYYTILKMFKGCEVVLDPFVGSGTTAAACLQLEKKFIGFDLDFDCCRMAKKRTTSGSLQPN
jgi:hypothetical protein